MNSETAFQSRPKGHSNATARNIIANRSAQLNTNETVRWQIDFQKLVANHIKACSVGQSVLLEIHIWDTKLLGGTKQHDIKQNTIWNSFMARVCGIVSIHMWQPQIAIKYCKLWLLTLKPLRACAEINHVVTGEAKQKWRFCEVLIHCVLSSGNGS